MFKSVELPEKVIPLADKDGNLIKPKRRFLDWLPWKKQKFSPIGDNPGLNRAMFTVIKPDGDSTPAIKELDPTALRENSGPNGIA